MARERVVVGAVGAEDRARQAARRLMAEGREVVYVGGRQTPEQLVRTLIAEDVATLLVDGDVEALARVVALCADSGAGDVVVTPLGPDGRSV